MLNSAATPHPTPLHWPHYLGGRSFWLLSLGGIVAATLLLIGLQWGSLSLNTPRGELLSLRIMPYILGFSLLSSLCFMAGMAQKWLLPVAWWSTLCTAGLCGGSMIAASWETSFVLERGYWALSNLYEVSVLLLFMVSLLCCWLIQHYKQPKIGTFTAPFIVANVLFIIWLKSLGQAGPRELVPALQSYWLPWHVLANFVGYAAFTLAAAASVLVLWRSYLDKKGIRTALPSVAVADSVAHKSIIIGLPVFTIAILLGSIWAYEAWGGYWSWDPKETWALIVWLCYSLYLHARITRGWSPQALAIVGIVGYGLTLFCFIGVNMFLSGLHSYGSLV